MMFARQDLAMTITITAFERSPDGGKGLARDTRVRWALDVAHGAARPAYKRAFEAQLAQNTGKASAS